MANCTACGSHVSDGSVFCGKCGAALSAKRVCQKCGNELAADMMFCDKCGTKYEAQTAPIQPATPPPQPQYTPPQPQYTPPQGQYAQSQGQYSQSQGQYAQSGRPASSVNTSGLTALSVLCLFFFWPLAIYGFVCVSNARKAPTLMDAETIVKKGKTACGIALGIGIMLFFIVLATS